MITRDLGQAPGALLMTRVILMTEEIDRNLIEFFVTEIIFKRKSEKKYYPIEHNSHYLSR